MPLTEVQCRNAKPSVKAQKIFDEKGLYLQITPAGQKYWRFKYHFNGKEKLLALGVYPEITLKEARIFKEKARTKLREGIDPSAERKALKQNQLISVENNFEAVSREWYNNRKSNWTETYGKKLLSKLEKSIFPDIGTIAVNKMSAQDLLPVLRKVESEGTLDKAHRLLQDVGQIFRYAVAVGKTDRDITYDLRGALQPVKKQSLSHLQEKELPDFLKALEKYDGDIQTKIGVKLLLQTFVRTIELRGAKWDEFDLQKAEWRIPRERMKMRETHIVPLSKQVLSDLEELKTITGKYDYILPHRTNPKKFISENTILYALYRMGYHSRTTGHGFRHTASTILNENGFNADAIERQLAHHPRNKVRATYNYAQYLPERKIIMQWWADLLEAKKTTQ